MVVHLKKHFLDKLNRLVDRHNKESYGRDGKINTQKVSGAATRADRKRFFVQMFSELRAMGFHLVHPESLKEKHIFALTSHWDKAGIAVKTLHTRVSMIRLFARWINKPTMVKDIETYFPGKDITRTNIAQTNLAWAANDVDAQRIIEQGMALDERFGLMLRLQKEFGLRVKESIEIYPLRSVSPDGKHLHVVDGTKGGLSRVIPIRTDSQRETVAAAQALSAKSGGKRMRWDGLTYRKANRRFYAMAEKLGLTKKDLGVTAHGLRHQYAQGRHRDLTDGHPSPIEMKPSELPTITYEVAKQAGQALSLELGHRRDDVGASYYGSWGHQLRVANTTINILRKLGV